MLLPRRLAGGSFLATSACFLQHPLATRFQDRTYCRERIGTYCLHRVHERMPEHLVLMGLDEPARIKAAPDSFSMSCRQTRTAEFMDTSYHWVACMTYRDRQAR